MPNYGYYQAEGIPIGSGSVESWVKRIDRRTQISGAQWREVPALHLKKGSVGTIVEYYPMSHGQESRYSLEGLIPQDTVEVSESQIAAISTPSPQIPTH